YIPALKSSQEGRDLECDVSVEEDNRQEWIFTLYDFDNSGKVTKEDMSSLMHTIYDVVDASVNHSSCHSKRKTLRVKLTVAPEPSARRRDHISTGPDRESGRLHQEEGRSADRRLSSHIRPALPGQSSEGQHYCVDENTERRNHYLDLAGIENYTSRFEGSTPPPPPQETHVRASQSQNRSRSQEPEAHAAHAHQRRSQVISENYTPLEARGRGASHFLKSPRGTSKGSGVGGTNGGLERAKSSKYHVGGHYPPQPPPLQTLLHTGNSSSGGHGGQDVYHLPSSSHHQHPLQHSHSKRLRAKAREGQGLSPSKTPPVTSLQSPASASGSPSSLSGEGEGEGAGVWAARQPWVLCVASGAASRAPTPPRTPPSPPLPPPPPDMTQ
uniref:protein naked cuticle homolog 2-like n=1 Tax=Oncorhynchus gorbuscha TaxID=8017 RepID=UPI001EAE8C89